jgi:hypothetical protein
VSATLVGLEDLDVDDAKDEIKHKEYCGDGHIRYDFWVAAEALVARSIRWTLREYARSLLYRQSNLCAKSILKVRTGEPDGP